MSLAKRLLKIQEEERESWLSRIIELILAQNLDSPHVTTEHIKIAIEECVEPSKLKDTETIFNVINGFDTPKIKYDISKKKYIIDNEGVYPEAQCKSLIFKHRFEIIWYKTLRHKQYLSSNFEKQSTDKINLIPIEYLLSELKTENVCIMGLLTQLTEDQYYLEDTSGSVKIDLSNTISFMIHLVFNHHTLLRYLAKYQEFVLKMKFSYKSSTLFSLSS